MSLLFLNTNTGWEKVVELVSLLYADVFVRVHTHTHTLKISIKCRKL